MYLLNINAPRKGGETHSHCQPGILSRWILSRRLTVEHSVQMAGSTKNEIHGFFGWAVTTKKDLLQLTQTGSRGQIVWSLFSVLSVPIVCCYLWHFWLIINCGLLPVHKPTLHRHSQSCPNPCRTPNQASFNKNLKCWFFMNHGLRSNTRPFWLEACTNFPALWFCIQNSSWTPLCFPL